MCVLKGNLTLDYRMRSCIRFHVIKILFFIAICRYERLPTSTQTLVRVRVTAYQHPDTGEGGGVGDCLPAGHPDAGEGGGVGDCLPAPRRW